MGIGSVSEHLVRQAQTPVLVVKRTNHESRASHVEGDESTLAKSQTVRGKEDPNEEIAAEKEKSAADARGKDASRGDDDFLGPPEQGFAKGTR
jgi:hypothetical protein